MHPRPRGCAPPQYPIWDGALGNWVDTAGNARPITSRKERRLEHQKERRRAAAVAFASERDRNAERGREYVGLTIQIPWTAWGSGYETSAEYSTATVIEYKPETREGNSKKIVSRFHVAFDPELDYDDTHLSWDELLGKSPCRLGSRYAILDTQPGKPLGRRQLLGRSPTRVVTSAAHGLLRDSAHVPVARPCEIACERSPCFCATAHGSTRCSMYVVCVVSADPCSLTCGATRIVSLNSR